MKAKKRIILLLATICLLCGSMVALAGDKPRKCPVGSCGRYNYSYVSKEGAACRCCDISVYDYFKCICGAEYRYCWNGHLQ